MCMGARGSFVAKRDDGVRVGCAAGRKVRCRQCSRKQNCDRTPQHPRITCLRARQHARDEAAQCERRGRAGSDPDDCYHSDPTHDHRTHTAPVRSERHADSNFARPLRDSLTEFETYIRNHREFIPNSGERYRQGETISTAFVESTIQQVVSRRLVKKQQRAWTLRGTPLLLPTRTKVLNHELEEVFRRWYPRFGAEAA